MLSGWLGAVASLEGAAACSVVVLGWVWVGVVVGKADSAVGASPEGSV
jgi:hypothetical protein